MNTASRFHEPGLGTLLVHGVVILLLAVAMTPLLALRLIAAPLAEGLIRVTDRLGDALAERLTR